MKLTANTEPEKEESSESQKENPHRTNSVNANAQNVKEAKAKALNTIPAQPSSNISADANEIYVKANRSADGLPKIKLTVSEKAEKSLRGGHVWVYRDEIKDICGDFENGDIADVYSQNAKYLGSGFLNLNSKIAVRIISKNRNDRFTPEFWKRRIRYSVSYRKAVMNDEDFKCCRLIFGEADTFPGLVVDRYNDILSVQAASLGIEKIKDIIFPALINVLGDEFGVHIRAIYERNDLNIRTLEGMKEYKSFYAFPSSEKAPANYPDGITIIKENNIMYEVDYINGQKTGFFLDQKYNRAAIQNIARDRQVLDCFTHTGSFGLNAAFAGAEHVTSVDISASALETARKNAALNHLEDKITYVQSDVFDFLDNLIKNKESRYNFVILDPPPFAKSRSILRNAIKGYRELNRKAMQILPRGGYLATCSCSHFMTDAYFRQMLHNAASDASVSLRQVDARAQSPDHPILWNVPETNYLKFYIFQIV